MKQLLFLLLFPCLALAQYTGNAGQKITLGEQTTADGLVFRGVASIDTVTATSKITRANKQDTSAFILLDTVTNLLWHYKTASNGWIQAGGSTFDTTTLNLVPRFAAKQNNITLSTTGTSGAATFNSNTLNIPNYGSALSGYLPLTGGTLTGALTGTSATFSGLITLNSNEPLILNRTNNTSTSNAIRFQTGGNTQWYVGSDFYLQSNTENFGFYNSGYRLVITPTGNVGIGTTSPQSGYRLHVVDSVYVGGNVSASAYTTRSDYDLKDEIQNISYGINEVMQMQPVKYTYKSNGSTQLGFIAQDLGVITPEVVSFEDKMSVYYNALIPILTKAIQEQQALIKALEQRILTLENK